MSFKKEYEEFRKAEIEDRKRQKKDKEVTISLGVAALLDKYISGELGSILINEQEYFINFENDFKSLADPKDRMTVFIKMIDYLKEKQAKEEPVKTVTNGCIISIKGQQIKI